jgi:hypothetical protein
MAKPSPHPVWIPVKTTVGKGRNRGQLRIPLEIVLKGDYAFISFRPLGLTEFEISDPQFDGGSWSDSLELMAPDLPEVLDTLS